MKPSRLNLCPALLLFACGLFGPLSCAAKGSEPILVMPFDLYDKRIWLPVLVNGSGPLDFLFDSAAGSSTVSKRAADRLRLSTPYVADADGAGDGSQRVAVATDLTISIDRLSYRVDRAPLVDLDIVARGTGRHADGLVGREFLEKYVVEFDYEKRQMTVYEPDGYQYSGSGTILPIEFKRGGPVLRGALRMPEKPSLPVRLLIDAPHNGALLLTSPFVNQNQLLDSARILTPRLRSSAIGGVGGDSAEFLGRAGSLEIGPYSFQRPVTAFSGATGGTLASGEIDGIIGAEIIRRFRIIYDFPRRRVILEPGKSLAEPFAADMSGLKLRFATAELKAIRVEMVAEGSPAAEAGIRDHDLLLEVNSRPATDFKLPDLKALFENEGEVVRLKIARDSQQREVSLKLRPLL
jgi:hypothetical protein